jgi:hypothetical protein
MKFLLVIVVLVVIALAGGWWFDRSAAKRGVRVTGVRHTGLRREITIEKVDDDGLPVRRPGAEPPVGRPGAEPTERP